MYKIRHAGYEYAAQLLDLKHTCPRRIESDGVGGVRQEEEGGSGLGRVAPVVNGHAVGQQQAP